jgi:tetratricopeptide (TPR) repeat protein
LAQNEMEKRHDVWTLDAYAWALYANGRFQEADAAIQKAIAVGIQSAQIFDHAGHIARNLGHASDAARDFKLAMQVNPLSVYADDARVSMELSQGARRSTLAVSPRSGATKSPSVGPLDFGNENAMSHSALSIEFARHTPPTFSPVPIDLLTPAPTETEQRIKSAQARVAQNPKDAQAYSALGAAHYQRARETGDVSDFELAEQSLTKSLDLVSGDFVADEPLEAMAEVCMGEHRFADAVSYSQRALSLGSGDVSPFAILGDAYADMGEYERAGHAYERLTPSDMALSPRAAYARDSRIAYLKFIAGDTPQAIRLMKIAVAEGTEARLPSENLAWLFFELGEFYAQQGDAEAADSAYLSALRTHPGDFRAMAGLGKLRGNQGRYAEAIFLYQKAVAVVPMPIFVAALGDLYAKSGNQAEAAKQYQVVEYIGLLGHINQVLHNRDLALFYADHDIKLAEALELANKEFEVRHDIYTWDALAWALYKNGKYAEAAKASQRSLQFGTRDSLLLYHAGVIAEAVGRKEQARVSLRAALEINPHFHLFYAESARQKLDLLDARASVKEDNNAR